MVRIRENKEGLTKEKGRDINKKGKIIKEKRGIAIRFDINPETNIFP